jgi:uncharacterized membrane protein YebE (DUF533 family)
MFDAKSLFEELVRGARPQQGTQSSGGGLGEIGDLLRQFTQQPSGKTRQPQGGGSANQTDTGAEPGSALDDLLRQFTKDRGASTDRDAKDGGTNTPGSNPLDDLLRQFAPEKNDSGNQDRGGHQMQELPDASSNPGGQQSAGGGIGDIMGQIFGKGDDAASGKSGQSLDQIPGIRDLFEKIGGKGTDPNEIVGQIKDFINNNKLGTGAALGGLGALVFGTRTGRSLAIGAAKIGALAVIGGLAYQAYQNYSQGRPLVSGSTEPEAAPNGTGFEEGEVSNEAAVTYIRGMIAAAAADGRINAEEQEQIIGTLSQQGLDANAEQFLANELNNPASIDELVAGVSNQAESLQLYTAARVSIEPDTQAEQQFLAQLADRLGITPDLRAHVDAAARNMA